MCFRTLNAVCGVLSMDGGVTMKWFQADEGMSPAEAKDNAIGVLHLWLYCRGEERTRLRHKLERQYRRVRRFASENVSDPIVRRFTKALELFCFMSAMWTLSHIFKLAKRIKEIRDAIDQLLDDEPDLAIHLIADGMPPDYANPSLEGSSVSSISSNGGTCFFLDIIHGLNAMKKAKVEAT